MVHIKYHFIWYNIIGEQRRKHWGDLNTYWGISVKCY
jgi:hypothetical protein